jgi:hypothetical protein
MSPGYVFLVESAAALCALAYSAIGWFTATDEEGHPLPKYGWNLPARVRVRYRAHPAAVWLQVACLSAALALLAVAGVNLRGW